MMFLCKSHHDVEHRLNYRQMWATEMLINAMMCVRNQRFNWKTYHRFRFRHQASRCPPWCKVGRNDVKHVGMNTSRENVSNNMNSVKIYTLMKNSAILCRKWRQNHVFCQSIILTTFDFILHMLRLPSRSQRKQL